ncbi:MAG: hypothetical protein AAGG07_01175 [Planctomycetota bacterium]
MGRVWAHSALLDKQYRPLRWLVVVLLVLSGGVLLVTPNSLRAVGLVLLGAGFVWLALGLIRQRRSAARLRARLDASDDLLCLECGYDLTGAAHENGLGVCPECGQGFDVEEIRAGWAIARHRDF